MLSDTVAEQIAKRRDQLDLTRAELADRCAKLGWPDLTYGVVSSIETGRPDKKGRRRREVSVDELAIIARALQVPPILLIAPLGYEDQVEMFPGYTVPVMDAYEYLIGGRVVPDGDPADGKVGLAEKVWSDLRVSTYRDFQKVLGDLWHADQQRDEDLKAKAWDQLQALQRTMQEHGWRIPPLSDFFDETEARNLMLAAKPKASGEDLRVDTLSDYETAVARWVAANRESDRDARLFWWRQVGALRQTMLDKGWSVPPLPGDDLDG